jgi:hypothetical protein
VVVMLQSKGGGVPEPVAVLGFADGKPKIGENILKIIAGQPYYFNALRIPRGLYAGQDKGPDGKPLGLTLQCRKLTLAPPEPEVVILPDGWYQEMEMNAWVQEAGTETWNSGLATATVTTSEVAFEGWVKSTIYSIKATIRAENYAYLAVIGPILFWIDVTKVKVEQEPLETEGTENFEGTSVFCISHAKSTINNPDPLIYQGENIDVTYQWCLDYLEAFAESLAMSGPTVLSPPARDHTPEPVPDQISIGNYPVGSIYAAVYTKELYDKAVKTTSREQRPKEFIEQIAGQIMFREIPGSIMPNMAVYENISEVSFFVKPHSKGDTT